MKTILLSLTFLCVTPVVAQDWPDFRGPERNGIVKGMVLPTEWGPKKNLVWKAPIPGTAWSSPCIVKGRIYLTNAVPKGDDHSLRALCIDARNGKVLWDEEVFLQDGDKAPNIHRKNSHASPTPLVEHALLYVHFGHQGTACLDLNGKVVWKNNDYRYAPVHGNGGTPIIVDDALIFSCDGRSNPFIVALNRKTGKELWKTPRNTDAARKFSFTTPQLITVKGQKQIISPGSNRVCAYDPKTGKKIWHATYNGYSVIPRPVYGHGLVFICTGYNRPSLLAIRPTGTGDVTKTHIAWTYERGVPHTASLLLVGEELYMVSDRGIATCLDAKTGTVHWTQRLNGSYSASPIYNNGNIYFVSENGLGTVIKAGKKFEQVAKNDLEERTLASYAAADGALFIRTAEHLYRFEKK